MKLWKRELLYCDKIKKCNDLVYWLLVSTHAGVRPSWHRKIYSAGWTSLLSTCSMLLALFRSTFSLKGTVSVILSDPSCKDSHVRFTTVPLFIFICSFSAKVTCAFMVYKKLAKSPGVARGKKNWIKKTIFETHPSHSWVSTKNVSPFGPAVWPAMGNIYVYNECLVLLYR